MKRKLLLFPLIATLGALSLSSYSSGPFATASQNRTGSAGSQANCAGSGCHAANSSNTLVTINVTNSGGNPVTSYTPGATYTVRISGTNTSALPKFGFQSTIVRVNALGQQAGTFTSTGSIAVRTAATPDIVEHSAPLTGSVGGGSAIYAATYTWTAPNAGAGTVRVLATLNAVNGDGQVSGDEPAAATPVDLTETVGGTNVPAVNTAVLNVYPNPASGSLSLRLPDAISQGSYQIRDVRGAIVSNGSLSIAQGLAQINLSSLSSGAYFVQVQAAGSTMVAPFVKN